MSTHSSFSWWSKRKEKKTQRSKKTNKAKEEQDDLGKPTGGEYAAEAAKEFLKVLEAVAQEIPVPGVGAAVKIATNLIRMCEDSHATLERAEELKIRIKALVTVLIDELKGKKADDIQEKLRADIESLEGDLHYIQIKLEEILSQSSTLVILFKSFNQDKVQKCVDRLNTSLERFNLSREINYANLLNRLEKQILAFHQNHQMSLERIQYGIDDIKIILGDRSGASTSSSSLTRAAIPANTSLFYGRDNVVADLVEYLTHNRSEGQKMPRACILGPGGMGKTSTALAAMAHTDVKKCFSEKNQVWVPCVKATSIPLFFDTLSQSLCITKTTGDPRTDILSELKSAESLILLLDNFETSWNIDGGRSETERMLRDIERISHITLFVTMRSSTPPCMGIQWHAVDLKAVDAQAAHQIYSEIHSEAKKDPKLPELLKLVGYMPLAITLMASFGNLTGFTAGDLLEQYNRTGTTMLGQGSDAEHSMDICISLSVDSPPMKRHPEAFELLARLAMLPVGTAPKTLMTFWAHDLKNMVGALEILRETSLVERQKSAFVVLPVIQRYVLDPSRFPSHIRASMVELACSFLAQHNSSPSNASYKEHAAAISAEEGNLQAILLETTAPTPGLIDALLVLAQYQRISRPRTDIIDHAVKLVFNMGNSSSMIGRVLMTYGLILFSLQHYDPAVEQFERAREHFLSIPDRKEAAMCLLNRLDVYAKQLRSHEQQKTLLESAKAEFEAVDDARGIALCLYQLGRLSWRFGGTPLSPEALADAVDSLGRSRAMLKEPLHTANCSCQIAVAYFCAQQYQQARTWATSATQEFERIGYYNYEPAIVHGCACIANADYDGALQVLIPALEAAKSYGSPLVIADVLEATGLTWALMGKKVDARGAFEESLRYSSLISGATSATRCKFFLRKMGDPKANPSWDENTRLWEHYYFDIARML